ncbi:MAG: hypothetical protein Q8P97_02070 [bacterium]|nr:hypothetical protein [bacterium]
MAKYYSKKMSTKTVAGAAIFCSVFYLSLFAAVGGTSLGVPMALAEDATGTPPTSAPSGADCKLEDALKALLDVKDSDLSPPDRDQAELNARKGVLSQIVICSEVELGTFKKRLTDLDLKSNDKKDELLRDKFLGDIGTIGSYFSDINNRLAGDIDLEGVKALAKEFSEWRETFYIPTLSNLNDFALVIQNQQAIKTARARFDKIFFSLSAVKLNNTTDIKKLLNESDGYIKKGAELNEQAHALAWTVNLIFDNASSSPTSTAVTTTSSSTATSTTINASSTALNATSTPEVQPAQPILPLVRDSLGELKKAYGDYLAISNIVKKYLGL